MAEVFYRRLMRVHAHAGRTAEAVATYRRCCNVLSAVLGVSPSRETETLHASFRP